MVKTAKRRTQPEEFKGELKMEHEQCHAWYKYISSELQKIAVLLNDQTWPPGHVSGTTFTPKPVVVSESLTTPTKAEANPFEE